MNETIEINQERLQYLLDIYGVSKVDILTSLNIKRKKKLTAFDVFNDNIKLSILKQIDKLFFGKGLSFYTNPQQPSRDKNASLFFRKTNFKNDLTQADRWRVNLIQSEIDKLRAIQKLSDYKITRILPTYTIDSAPEAIARQIRRELGINFRPRKDKDFLKSFIFSLAENDILVTEFVEAHNLKKKTTWEGMFLSPNIIAIKRQQNAFKREIFTLAHELGHYLLEYEEIDNDILASPQNESQYLEHWCNDFAFYFLLGDYAQESLQWRKSFDIEDSRIKELSQICHISPLAIYTHLAIQKTISWDDYEEIKRALKKDFEERQRQEKERKELERLRNSKSKGGGTPQPIHTPLEQNIYRHAYFKGVIEEIDILNYFKPNKQQIRSGFIDKILYGETV